VIEISHVTKTFGKVVAVRDVSLSIGPGERVAFVGANGSGKTTLLRAVLGLLRIEGRVAIDGIDVARSPELALRSVAYMPQIAPPMDAPVREVVTALCRLRDVPERRVTERAERLGLVLADVARVRFRDLSGGTKQKVLAALALAAEAPLLVCDEPTANLDADARSAFFAELDARPRHHVTLLCSHRSDEVTQLVDRVVEMDEGRVRRDASVEQLLLDRRRFRVQVVFTSSLSESAERFLRESGFVTSGNRWEALVTQADKVAVVARLLRENGNVIADLSVDHVEDLGLDRRQQSRPRLKAVS
jgi:ABC-type multidrug transport system ATPase subunit